MSHCGRVHMAYDSKFAWGVQAGHSSSSLTLSCPFPPSPFFLSNNGLSPLSLSSWSYLLFHSPAKQLPSPDSTPFWTAWLTSFLSTIKVRYSGDFMVILLRWPGPWQRASSVKPEHSRHSYIIFLPSYSIKKRMCKYRKWLKGLSAHWGIMPLIMQSAHYFPLLIKLFGFLTLSLFACSASWKPNKTNKKNKPHPTELNGRIDCSKRIGKLAVNVWEIFFFWQWKCLSFLPYRCISGFPLSTTSSSFKPYWQWSHYSTYGNTFTFEQTCFSCSSINLLVINK